MASSIANGSGRATGCPKGVRRPRWYRPCSGSDHEIVHAIDQPWGVSIAEVTVRAAGDYFIL